MELKRNTTTFTYSTDTQTLILVLVLFVFHRPSASELLTHAFFKQVGFFSQTSSLKAKVQKQNRGNKFKRVGFYFENWMFEKGLSVLLQVKRHTRDSFLSLMYPAVPLASPEDPPVSSPPTPSCHTPASATADSTEAVWDFS